MGTRDARQGGITQGQGQDAFNAPGAVVPSQQNYGTGTGAQGGLGVGQQGGRTINDQSQKNGGQGYDSMDQQGAWAGLGTGRTVGARDNGGENTNPFLGGKEHDHSATRGNDNTRDTGNTTGSHTGRHVAEAGVATGAAAGLVHHEKGEHGDGGLFHNDEQRQHERDFAGNQTGTGTGIGTGASTGLGANTGLSANTGRGANTGLSGTYDGHDAMHPNQHSALGTSGVQPGAGTLGTPSEHVLGGHGAGLGTGTGKSTGLQSGNGTGATGGAHDTGANYATGQAPGTNAAGVGSGYGNGSGLGPNAGGAGRTGQSTGSGTTDIIIGKLEQGVGMLLSNDKMRAKGLEKEAKGEAQRNVSHSRELDQEATTLRERSAQKNNVGVGSGIGAGIGSAHDGKSGKRVQSEFCCG